jgi:hypothetical protein
MSIYTCGWGSDTLGFLLVSLAAVLISILGRIWKSPRSILGSESFSLGSAAKKVVMGKRDAWKVVRADQAKHATVEPLASATFEA